MTYPIAFDLDGTISEAPDFFSKLSQIWDDDVYVITYRNEESRQETVAELEAYGIRYTKLFLVHSFEKKAEIIKKYGIKMYWDDMAEMTKNVDSNCKICLFRNEGNFDFADKRWMFSSKTAKLLF